MAERTDGRMDRPKFIGPFQPQPGVQKMVAEGSVVGKTVNENLEVDQLLLKLLEVENLW